MANIRNSISLTDRMTPTLRSILKAMDSTLRVMKNLDKAANNGIQSNAYKRAERDIKRANNQLIKMGNYTEMANRAARDGQRAYSGMGKEIDGASAKMQRLTQGSHQFIQSLASAVYLVKNLGSTLGGLMNIADNSRSQVARLGLYNTSEYTNEQLYGQVFATAMHTRSGLTETADLANKILISEVYSGEGSAQAAIGTAGLINRAMVAGGGTREENERAIRQLTQGLASGVLQGDELRSIREQTPYFAQVLAEGLSKIDDQFEGIGIGDLKKLGSEGELTADRVIKAMWAMQDEINSDFKSMPKTFGQVTTSLLNIWQYFLWLLSDTEGPLGRINETLWTMVDYLQSEAGFELLNGLATGMNVLSWAITGTLGLVGDFIVFLQQNSNVAQAVIFALATAFIIAAVSAAVAWISAAWPILLIITLVGILVYELLEAGFTMSEIIGYVSGAVMFAIAGIWDAIIILLGLIMWSVVIIIEAVVALGAGIILTTQGVIQLILWVILTIYSTLIMLWDVIYTIAKGTYGVVKASIVGIYASFVGLGEGVLGILWSIASAIDAVFGSSLAGTVKGWMAGLGDSVKDLNNTLDPAGEFEDIETRWTTSFNTIGDMYTSDDWLLFDKMQDVWNGTGNIMGDVWDSGLYADAFLMEGIVDPTEWYSSGYDWGVGVGDSLGDFSLGLPDNSILDMNSLTGSIDVNSATVDGGYLDGIKSDVSISDEDIQLLRDMAARDYLLQLQSITPVAHVTFGDVRETADVNKIVDVIEQMVEEQMATALIS